jgi:hypothetical protein
MSVQEVFYHNEDGDEQICEKATEACIDITTCADQGIDLWTWLEDQVKHRLKKEGISFSHLYFED